MITAWHETEIRTLRLRDSASAQNTCTHMTGSRELRSSGGIGSAVNHRGIVNNWRMKKASSTRDIKLISD